METAPARRVAKSWRSLLISAATAGRQAGGGSVGQTAEASCSLVAPANRVQTRYAKARRACRDGKSASRTILPEGAEMATGPARKMRRLDNTSLFRWLIRVQDRGAARGLRCPGPTTVVPSTTGHCEARDRRRSRSSSASRQVDARPGDSSTAVTSASEGRAA